MNGEPTKPKSFLERLEKAFEEFRKSQETGVFYYLKIWDETGLRETESQIG